MRCASAILLIALIIHLYQASSSRGKFKELSKSNFSKLVVKRKSNCKYIKCPDKEDRACVQVKNKNGERTKIVYIAVINKCEIDYIKCHQGLEATLVPTEKCLHKQSIRNLKTTKKRLKRSPHIVTKGINNHITKHARKHSALHKSPYHNKYSSLYFGPKRKAGSSEAETNDKNYEDEYGTKVIIGNTVEDGNNEETDTEAKEYDDDAEYQKIVDREADGKEAQDIKPESEEGLVGKENDDKGSGDKEVILFNISTSNNNVYSKLAMDTNGKILSMETNNEIKVNKKDINENENISNDIKATETKDEERLDNFNNTEALNNEEGGDPANEDVLNNDEGGDLANEYIMNNDKDDQANEDKTIVITIDRKDETDENDVDYVKTQDVQKKTEQQVDNEEDDNEAKELQDNKDKMDSDQHVDDMNIETQKNIVDEAKSTISENDSVKNEESKDYENTDDLENMESNKGTPAEQKETIKVDVYFKTKNGYSNGTKALNNTADIEEGTPGKEVSGKEKKLAESDTSTEEDKKDVKKDSKENPQDESKNGEKKQEDNYDDLDNDQYNKDCPSVCPASDVMLCARCKEGVYRTFMSVCHLRMFNCKHPEEKLELVSRKPCILSAPFLNGMKTKGTVKERGNEDRVLRYIQCKEKDPGDPRCNFRRRARKRRING